MIQAISIGSSHDQTTKEVGCNLEILRYNKYNGVEILNCFYNQTISNPYERSPAGKDNNTVSFNIVYYNCLQHINT